MRKQDFNGNWWEEGKKIDVLEILKKTGKALWLKGEFDPAVPCDKPEELVAHWADYPDLTCYYNVYDDRVEVLVPFY